MCVRRTAQQSINECTLTAAIHTKRIQFLSLSIIYICIVYIDRIDMCIVVDPKLQIHREEFHRRSCAHSGVAIELHSQYTLTEMSREWIAIVIELDHAFAHNGQILQS